MSFKEFFCVYKLEYVLTEFKKQNIHHQLYLQGDIHLTHMPQKYTKWGQMH